MATAIVRMIEQCSLEVGFEVAWLFGEAGEFQHVGIANEVGDRAGHFRRLLASAIDDRSLVGGKTGALEEERADLALELAHGPVTLQALVFVEGAFPGIVDREEVDQVGPRKL